MPAVLVTYLLLRTTLLSTSSITAHHLVDFMVHGKITEADAPTICLDATPSGLSVPPHPVSLHFYAECSFATTLPIYPGLAQAPNNPGLHTPCVM